MIKLLLVEDDASLRYIVQGGLEDMIGGYEVIAAANGEEGLKQWKEQHPDVIVSDIEMPVMNGYEMVKRIRETDGETPILFSSALILSLIHISSSHCLPSASAYGPPCREWREQPSPYPDTSRQR